MKYAFAGTPRFAAWVLAHMSSLGRLPALVISQPDRPRGRGRAVSSPPAVVEAQRLGVPFAQTGDINEAQIRARLRKEEVEILVVASFGQLLDTSLLESVLCLNIHTSLLPAYRGPAPIERMLRNGDTVTGVTLMRISEGLDEGPWALRTSVSVGLRDDAGSVARALAALGAITLDQAFVGLEDDTLTWSRQEGPVSYAPKVTASDCCFCPQKSAKTVHDHVRSLSPSLGLRGRSGALSLKIWRTWPYGEAGLSEVPPCAEEVAGRPGLLTTTGGRLFVGCEEGAVELLVVQPAGRDRMSAAAFLRGYAQKLGDVLEPPPPEGRTAGADD